MSTTTNTLARGPESELNSQSMNLFEGMADDEKFSRLELESQCEESQLDKDSVALQSIWVTQDNGEQFHLRHFKPAVGIGRRIFMLHGEAESGRVYYDSKDRGLAWYLANRGYEVFVADLSCRGRSLASATEATALSVTDIITSSIPRFLQAISNTPSSAAGEESASSYYGCPADIWVGHGFGCVLLAAAWSRLPDSMRAASQMIFFAGRRRLTAKSGFANLLLSALNHSYARKCVERWNHFPAARLGLGSANESVGWYLDYTNWISAEHWKGADHFDYVAAMRENPLPSTLHLVAPEDRLYSGLEDVRLFIDELGSHDAQVLCYNYSAAGKLYNHLSLLLSQAAEQEVFGPLQQWLQNGVDGAVVDSGLTTRQSYAERESAKLEIESPAESGLAFA